MAHVALARAALRRSPRLFAAAAAGSPVGLNPASIRFRSKRASPPPPPPPPSKPQNESHSVLDDTTPSGKSDYDAVKTPPQPPPPPPPPPISEQPAESHSHPQSPASDTPPRPLEDVPPSSESGRPSSLSLDFAPEEAPGPERTGAKSSEGSLTSLEKKRRRIARIFMGMILVGLGYGAIDLGRPWEPQELNGKKPVEAEAGRWDRMNFRFKVLVGLFSEPAREQLLMPRGPNDQWPYVLVLSLDDLLVTSTWDRQHGWRTAKRPGVDYFLGYLSNWFEIVIFTTQPYYTAEPIIGKLDPLRAFIVDGVYREGTRYYDGKIVKDLSFLGRDPSKIVAVDTDPERYALQPENAIIVPKWNGDPKDTGLVGLIPFLESIGIYSPDDVRPIVSAYKGKDVVKEYSKVEAEAKRRHLEEWKKHGGGTISAPSLLGKIFGTSATPPTSGPPPTFLEKKRQEAQHVYREHTEYLKKNEEAIKKLYEDQKEAQLKEMGAYSLFGMVNGFMGGKPPGAPGVAPPEAGQEQHPQAKTEGTVVPITGK
ncbi:hypothetical protein M422DRAFT_26671 [Sphaerobolus stellatus SS14]|nr:hypothetical protein M422DRAFT_26671 [Sphaerobolus stellatus SS14]